MEYKKMIIPHSAKPRSLSQKNAALLNILSAPAYTTRTTTSTTTTA